MQPKISLKRSLIILGTVGVVFFLVIFLTWDSYIRLASRSASQIPQNPAGGAPLAPAHGLPIRLKIPEIGVDAAIEYVGLTLQGAVDVPSTPANAAWFDLGPRPGENGSAIIDGHYGWRNSIPAVFDDLYKLQKGDRLYVEDERGATIVFVVREIRMYGQSEDASRVFGSGDGKAHLNLITCDGAWNKTQQSYFDRLVVFTDEAIEP